MHEPQRQTPPLVAALDGATRVVRNVLALGVRGLCVVLRGLGHLRMATNQILLVHTHGFVDDGISAGDVAAAIPDADESGAAG